MKIIGFIYHHGEPQMVLKGDSCLLNGNKPMFMPDWSNALAVTECMILRVSRLGKEIAPKYANRYFDAITPGADFVAMDILQEAEQTGKPWTRALAFDYSLAIGEWISNDEMSATKLLNDELIISPEEAIAQASKVMTIRQGDLIYIHKRQEPVPVHKEDVITGMLNGEEKLHCKIK